MALPLDTEIMRVTLPLMLRYGIPPNPVNYFIWYEYICSHLPAEELDHQPSLKTQTERDEKFTELFEQYVTSQDPLEQRKSEDLMRFLRAALAGKGMDKRTSIQTCTEYFPKLFELGPDELENIVNYMIHDHTWGDQAEDSQVLTVLDSSNAEIELLKQEITKIREAAIMDSLTRIPNRREFDRVLDLTMQRHDPSEGQLCLLMIDIDHFKQVNDQYGHLVGDQILKFVAQSLKEQLKGRDLIARFGGEEFAVILEKTSLKAAIKLAEAIRKIISLQKIHLSKINKNTSITISVGVAAYRKGDTMETFIDRADRALYDAKGSGRNCVRSGTLK